MSYATYGLMLVLESKKEKGGISMLPVKMDEFKNIQDLEEKISTAKNIKKLVVWGIQYNDKEYNFEIDETKPLDYYNQENKTIQYILAKELDSDYGIAKFLGIYLYTQNWIRFKNILQL